MFHPLAKFSLSLSGFLLGIRIWLAILLVKVPLCASYWVLRSILLPSSTPSFLTFIIHPVGYCLYNPFGASLRVLRYFPTIPAPFTICVVTFYLFLLLFYCCYSVLQAKFYPCRTIHALPNYRRAPGFGVTSTTDTVNSLYTIADLKT